MTDLTLRDDLARRLEQIADREHRRVDEILETLLNRYDSFTRDERIIEEDERRQDRLRLYDRARSYWRLHSDARQHLSNDDLYEQFWVIDPDGIPRLKDEQSTILLPHDPFVQMLEMAESDPAVQWRSMSDIESTKAVLNREYTDHLLARLKETTTSDE